jgi:hypothetical protein
MYNPADFDSQICCIHCHCKLQPTEFEFILNAVVTMKHSRLFPRTWLEFGGSHFERYTRSSECGNHRRLVNGFLRLVGRLNTQLIDCRLAVAKDRLNRDETVRSATTATATATTMEDGMKLAFVVHFTFHFHSLQK